jgi:hypothetical protein
MKKEFGFVDIFCNSGADGDKLPPFSSLPCIERQMVLEWRTLHSSSAKTKATTVSAIHKHMAQRQSNLFDESHLGDILFSLSSCYTNDADIKDGKKIHNQDCGGDGKEDEEEFVRA